MKISHRDESNESFVELHTNSKHSQVKRIMKQRHSAVNLGAAHINEQMEPFTNQPTTTLSDLVSSHILHHIYD